ncbi:MAG: hypothetical protein IH597_16675 [Bacteroidales bacterium]|nr:hypothetical protein [Bacteroidales bacterium]
MNLKRIFGTILTMLGVAGLIYVSVLFSGNTETFKLMVIYGIIGLIFFISGSSLIRIAKDES